MPQSCSRAKKNPRRRCQSLLMFKPDSKRASFFFPPPPPQPELPSTLLLFLPPPTSSLESSSSSFLPLCAFFFFFFHVFDAEGLSAAQETRDKVLLCGAAAAAASAEIKGGNKRGFPGQTFLSRCLTDSRQLGPRRPAVREGSVKLPDGEGPRVTCPLWTAGREGRRGGCWLRKGWRAKINKGCFYFGALGAGLGQI